MHLLGGHTEALSEEELKQILIFLQKEFDRVESHIVSRASRRGCKR
jgi:hypothetical protein